MIRNIISLLGDSYLRKIFALRLVGNFLVISSVFFIVKTFYNPIVTEIRYFIDNDILEVRYKLLDPHGGVNELANQNEPSTSSQLASFLGVKNRQIITPIDPDYSIVVPKIAANARIIRNVDTSNESNYLEALKLGVAHAKGTNFPGKGGNIFLFAHSTNYVWDIGDYNAVFYLLHKLDSGDEIHVLFEGVKHTYVVSDKKVVAPDDVKYLTEATSEETLTLQTCWPPGTTFQRLLVFAKRKAV